MVRTIARRLRNQFLKPTIIHTRNSYSQAGEDLILNFLFTDKKVTKITYLDLGANIPDDLNNTYLFYLQNSSGVCVEPDRSLIESFKRLRPRDKVLNIGVGVYSCKEADFYVFEHHTLNTFNKEEAEIKSCEGPFRLVNTIKVELKNINEIIFENFDTFPDLLSIDIEGLDLQVLKTLDLKKYPIPAICVETCEYSSNHVRPKEVAILEFMALQDYFVYADTYINTIFVNKSWFYSNL